MTRLKTLLVLSFLGLSIFPTYSQEYYGKQKDIQQILENIKAFSQYYMAGDTEKLIGCYTSDGKIFPANRAIMEGRPELFSYWTTPEDIQILKHKITPSEIRVVKKYAYDYGYYEGETLLANGNKSSWKGKYVIVWKKVGKEWKIYLDIWNRVEDKK